jgi:hypothetical protein
MFSPRKLSVLIAFLALVLFAAPVRAADWPVEGDVTFTGGVPPTTTFTFVGVKGDGSGVTGSGQLDFDMGTGVISNGTQHLDWDDGSFSIDMTFQGQAFPDGTFAGTWAGGGLSGTFSGVTDFSTGAHTIFECS